MAFGSADKLQAAWTALCKNGWKSSAQEYYDKTFLQPALDKVIEIEREIEHFDAEIEEHMKFLSKVRNNHPDLDKE